MTTAERRRFRGRGYTGVGENRESLIEKRLKKAYFKKLITADQLKPHLEAGEELGKMLGGFIKYLRHCEMIPPLRIHRFRISDLRFTT